MPNGPALETDKSSLAEVLELFRPHSEHSRFPNLPPESRTMVYPRRAAFIPPPTPLDDATTRLRGEIRLCAVELAFRLRSDDGS
jgi:hypothetical protein